MFRCLSCMLVLAAFSLTLIMGCGGGGGPKAEIPTGPVEPPSKEKAKLGQGPK